MPVPLSWKSSHHLLLATVTENIPVRANQKPWFMAEKPSLPSACDVAFRSGDMAGLGRSNLSRLVSKWKSTQMLRRFLATFQTPGINDVRGRVFNPSCTARSQCIPGAVRCPTLMLSLRHRAMFQQRHLPLTWGPGTYFVRS